MNIHTISLGPVGANCYIIEENGHSLIVDPGGEGERLLAWLRSNHFKPAAILLTHAHFDHIGAVDQVREAYQIPVYLHRTEADWLTNPKKNGSDRFPVGKITAKPLDHYLAEGNMEVGTFEFSVLHTPGHSPGSVSIVFEQELVVFSGDALFQRGIGRTDLYGGDQVQLLESIRNSLFTLPENFTVYPGHGEPTFIGDEKQFNPFLN